MAKLVGAEVYGTASPKHDAIRGFGVDHPIDYRTHDVVDEVRRVAGERHPLDLALDGIGGRSLRQSFSLPTGRAASSASAPPRSRPASAAARCGRSASSGADAALQAAHADARVEVRDRPQHAAAVGRARVARHLFEPLRVWLDEGALRPVVAREFRLDDGPEAHRYIHERKNVGKVVLTL